MIGVDVVKPDRGMANENFAVFRLSELDFVEDELFRPAGSMKANGACRLGCHEGASLLGLSGVLVFVRIGGMGCVQSASV